MFGFPSVMFGLPSVMFGLPSVMFGLPSVMFGLPSVMFGLLPVMFGALRPSCSGFRPSCSDFRPSCSDFRPSCSGLTRTSADPKQTRRDLMRSILGSSPRMTVGEFLEFRPSANRYKCVIVARHINVILRLSTSSAGSQRHPPATQRHPPALNVIPRLSTSSPGSQRHPPALNVIPRLSTSSPGSQRHPPALNVIPRLDRGTLRRAVTVRVARSSLSLRGRKNSPEGRAMTVKNGRWRQLVYCWVSPWRLSAIMLSKRRSNSSRIGIPPDRNALQKHLCASVLIPCLSALKLLYRSKRRALVREKNCRAHGKRTHPDAPMRLEPFRVRPDALSSHHLRPDRHRVSPIFAPPCAGTGLPATTR